MATQDPKLADFKDIPVEEKLLILYEMQKVDSEIDKIRTLRGELPLEVQDLEDDVEGLETRINNLNSEVTELSDSVTKKKQEIKDAEALIKKYEAQQMNVRNNREFDSISKEIEFQNLEIELCEKRIKEFTAEMNSKKELMESSQASLEEKMADLNLKKSELEAIIADTQIEEERLIEQSSLFQKKIEERLFIAYSRIRSNARNGLAIVAVERDACGGCFNKIPPQRNLDIRSRKKIIVCEYCGRILVDSSICDPEPTEEEKLKTSEPAKPKKKTRKIKAK